MRRTQRPRLSRPLLTHRSRQPSAVGRLSVGHNMTLKPNYLRGFVVTALWIFALITVFSGVIPSLRGKPVRWEEIFQIATMGAAFLGVSVCVMFTPREIKWDDGGISLRVIFPKSGEYTWRQLEAYSTWGGRFATFLLKLEGMQSYQIVPVCFRADDWRAFQSYLRSRFPEKKTSIWFGPIPVRFGKK